MKNLSWKIVVSINVILGIILWFGHLTDYSWSVTLLDILFPPIVGIVGWFSLSSVVIKTGISGTKTKFLGNLACLPSLFGGALAVLSVILMLVPPFTMGFVFMMAEMGDEVVIQQSISPDGLRVAQVYFTPVGAYGSGNGRISVRVKPRLFPLVEREVFFLNASYADDEDTTDYLSWVDTNTLAIQESEQEFRARGIGLELSPAIAVPINLFRYYQSWRLEQQLIAPVRDVPIFPGDVTYGDMLYRHDLDIALRFYSIRDYTADELAEWYLQALSEPPWSVIQVNRDLIQGSSAVHTEYCIEVQRDEGGETRVYFWEIEEWEGHSRVHVDIATPKPLTDICFRHLDESWLQMISDVLEDFQ